jgi:energy-coupling factor transport system substrate-specific component
MTLNLQRIGLIFVSLIGLIGFLWPLWLPQAVGTSESASGWLALALLPLLAIIALWFAQGKLAGPRQIALLGLLAAIAAATRIATSGVGGFELVFVVVILGAAALGARFGFLLGATAILLSSLFFGGIGPWTAFQVFAVGWVGAGAGLIGKRLGKRLKSWQLAIYAAAAAYLFGLIMNLWFWPFAVGPQTSISFDTEASMGQNLVSFLTYSLVSSTLTWDTVRAISSAVLILLIGKPFIDTLRRYKF